MVGVGSRGDGVGLGGLGAGGSLENISFRRLFGDQLSRAESGFLLVSGSERVIGFDDSSCD